MALATAAIGMKNADAQGRRLHLPVKSGTQIYAGTFVSQMTATGLLVPTSTAGAGPAVGKATMSVLGDGTNRCEVETDCTYRVTNGSSTDAFAESSPLGSPVYALDDHTGADNSNSGTLQALGTFRGMEADGTIRVYVNSDQGYVSPTIQAGRGTFASGVLAVSAGITVTATSRVFASRVTEAGTDGDEIRIPDADRTAGGPGVGALTFRSFLSGVAATSDTSTFDYLIVG